jgi:hypothetical protein
MIDRSDSFRRPMILELLPHFLKNTRLRRASLKSFCNPISFWLCERSEFEAGTQNLAVVIIVLGSRD